MRFEPEVLCNSVREATVIWYRSGTQFTFSCDPAASATVQNLRQVGAPMSLSGANDQSVIVSEGMVETSRERAAQAIARYRHESGNRKKNADDPHQLRFRLH